MHGDSDKLYLMHGGSDKLYLNLDNSLFQHNLSSLLVYYACVVAIVHVMCLNHRIKGNQSYNHNYDGDREFSLPKIRTSS